MKTTTYWKAQILDDHNAYSLRAPTKREVLALIAANGCEPIQHPDHGECFGVDGYARYAKPEKIEIHNDGQMDLIRQLMGEGGGSY